MANTKKYVSLDKLGLYDEKIKGVINAGDEAALKSAKDYADSLASNYEKAGAAATAETNAKAYTDAEAGRAKGEEARIEGLVNAAQGAVDALEEVVDTKAAQSDLDALEALVGTLPEDTTAKDVVDYVNIKTSGIATDAALAELQGKVTAAEEAIDAIEEDYLKAADKTELQGNIDALVETHNTDKAALEASIKGITDDYLKAEDKDELQGNINAVSAVANAAVKQADYDVKVAALDAEDARIAGLVATEQARAEGVEEDLDERLVKVEAFFEGAAEDAEGLQNALDTLVEIQTYVDTHGEAAAKMVEDIAANAKAIEDHAKIDHDFAAADATLKSELEGKINAKADKTTVEGIDGRLTTAEGKITTVEGKVSTLEGQMTTVQGAVATKAEAQALTDAVAALEGVDAGQETRIAALEAKFGEGEGNVESQIATAKQEAINAAAADATTKANNAEKNAKDYADGLNTAMDTRVAAVEAASATHALDSDLKALAGRVTTAEGEIDTLQSEMDAVEALAAANKAAHEANAAAIALKAAQADLEAVSGRVTTLETWHANFVECSQEDINGLFD